MKTESNPLFSTNVSDLRFIAFDTETTGMRPPTDAMVELAAVSFDEDFEQRTFSTLIDPGIAIPHVVTSIHGITDEMVIGKPKPMTAVMDFNSYLDSNGSSRVMLAHNAGFDLAFLHDVTKRFKGEGAASYELVIDTCMLAKALLPELPRHKLESLVNYFDLVNDRAHRALQDVRALKGVFMKLLEIAANRVNGRELTLGALVDLSGGYFVYGRSKESFSEFVGKKSFKLPPKISIIESLCGSEEKVSIVYDSQSSKKKKGGVSAVVAGGDYESFERDVSDDYRTITPIDIKIKGFIAFVEAYCHRDNIVKTFRADRIRKIRI